MERQKRNWHPNFLQYMEMIANHPNYSGMPEVHKEDGSIRWVVTGKSQIGREREAWWDQKRLELGIDKKPGWKAKTAFAIHPNKTKVCQVCGRSLRLDYIYPNKSCPLNADRFTACPGNKKCEVALHKFNGNCPHMGPGVMSDCPDRFDGFHTYNRCCRAKEDKGRHADNLSKYGEDRRAYEFWCDGDWKAASWLMKEFSKHGVSADHIGPISLGFCHRPRFRPMTRADNISKGNRMTYRDVKTLVSDEESGEQVISWHSKYIWDKYKNQISNNNEAKKLSLIMRKHMHTVLNILAAIHRRGYDEFLIRFLNPHFAFYQHEFEGFDPTTGKYKDLKKTKVNRAEHKRNAQRYIRISFEALDAYINKKNRNVKAYRLSAKCLECRALLLDQLRKKKLEEADKTIKSLFRQLASDINDTIKILVYDMAVPQPSVDKTHQI